jgi:iron-sulfur cluster repair protein YtfE (RIC family)
MTTLTDYMTRNHRECDEAFASAEDAVSAKDWAAARQKFDRLLGIMRRHFAMEEQVLFPAFEEKTGMSMGPTEVMRREHAQMNDLLGQMDPAVAAQDAGQFLGCSETLLVLMQQHNMKEEGMLYRMLDQVLSGDAQAFIGRLDDIAAS